MARRLQGQVRHGPRQGPRGVVFKAPDGSQKIHLLTKRGEGEHAADQLYLSAHVVLDGDDPQDAADNAETLLRRFLDVLAIVTSGYYRIDRKILVADWTPGLTDRRFLYFKTFPNPNVPVHALNQELVDSVSRLSGNEIPRPVRLAIRWWARGVGTSPPSDQFQYFWYALEILAEHAKPSVKVASKCPHCAGELFCQACNQVPAHRPFPKQAIKMLIEKHVRGDRERLYQLIDEARNRLLHGEDPREIEQGLGVKWEMLSDSLGRATWAAILSTLVNIDAANATERRRLALIDVDSYTHWEMTVASDMSMGATHVDPANPHIEEFWPDFKLEMIVRDPEEIEGQQPPGPG